MIDTQRLGALLRALIRDDAQDARLRTNGAAPVRPASRIGPELDAPDPQLARVPAQVAAQAARAASASTTDEMTDRDSALRAGADAPRHSDSPRLAPNGAAGRAPPSAALELSETGRLLLSALRAQGTPLDGVTVPRSAMQPLLAVHDETAPASATRARPLVAVPPHSEYATDRLALQLKDAVEFSGIFYESHLAQWADDLRPRALLAHEPQARWPVAADIAQSAATPGNAPADYATPVLRQQLEVLDTGRFLWTGELWPGQRGALVIEEDDAPPPRPGDDTTPHAPRWRVRLTLEFAQLGAIDASLLMSNETVDLGLRCSTFDIAERLRAATPTLRTAIAERALDLAHVSIADGRAA
jgi:flagellar hook-length control protein FliK